MDATESTYRLTSNQQLMTTDEFDADFLVKKHSAWAIDDACLCECVTYRLQLMVPNVEIASAICQPNNSSFHILLQLYRVYLIEIDTIESLLGTETKICSQRRNFFLLSSENILKICVEFSKFCIYYCQNFISYFIHKTLNILHDFYDPSHIHTL